ncbi:MAG: hypothetical protein HND58_16660 [Planctomycetota bacterium]|nr:MAG: hypothetical protein HND58_16660 [Planctomycetota bacterium]
MRPPVSGGAPVEALRLLTVQRDRLWWYQTAWMLPSESRPATFSAFQGVTKLISGLEKIGVSLPSSRRSTSERLRETQTAPSSSVAPVWLKRWMSLLESMPAMWTLLPLLTKTVMSPSSRPALSSSVLRLR